MADSVIAFFHTLNNFLNFAAMKKLLLLTFAILTIGLLPVLLNFGRIGYLDFTMQQIPFILETKRMLASGAPWWSWNTFTGDNFLAGYSFYTLTSPFVWLAVLFPYRLILWGVLLALYLKMFCASAFSWLFFRKMGLSEDLSTVGALLYAFSSFAICNLYYFHFEEPLLLFPLLLIALENVLRGGRRRYLLLALIAFAITFVNYYFAFPSLLLGLLYLLFRGWNQKSLSLALLCRSVLAVLLGVGMAAFILFPVAMAVMGSARALPGRGVAALAADDPGFPVRVLGKYIPRIQSFFVPSISEKSPGDSVFDSAGWISVEAFVTLFGLLPVCVYVVKKRDWLAWLIVLLVIIFLTPLNGIFYLFTSVSYGRWLYGLLLLMILASLMVVKERIRISLLSFWLYVALCLVIVGANILVSLYASSSIGQDFELSSQRFIIAGLLVVNLICLCIWVCNRDRRRLLLAMVSVCCMLNLAAFSNSLILSDADLDEGQPYPMQSLLSTDNFAAGPVEMEYRTDYIGPYRNVAMLQNDPGVYSFHSVYNKNLIPFRSAVDPDYSAPDFKPSEISRESMAAMMSVKEIKDFSNPQKPAHHSFPYFIPMGYSYDSYILSSELERYVKQHDTVDVPRLLLASLAVNGEDEGALAPYLRKTGVSAALPIDSLVSARGRFTATGFKGNSRGFTCNTDFDRPRVLFFSVPADSGFKAEVNGEPTRIYNVNLGMSAIVVPAGKTLVRFSYFPPGLLPGLIVSGISFLVFLILLLSPRLRPQEG